MPTVSQFGLNNVLYSEETYGADVKVLVSESVVRPDLLGHWEAANGL